MFLLFLLLSCAEPDGSIKFINGWKQINSGFNLLDTESIKDDCFIFTEEGKFITDDISGFMGQDKALSKSYCITEDSKINIDDIFISIIKESENIWEARINWEIISLTGEFKVCDSKQLDSDTISIYQAEENLSCN